MNNLIYIVMSVHLDDSTIQGVFSTEALAQEFMAAFKAKNPEEYSEDNSWYSWMSLISMRVDEEIIKLKYPIYQIEYDVESEKWNCKKIDTGLSHTLLEEVCFVEDENDDPEWYNVDICNGESEDEIFKHGQALIKAFIKKGNSK